MKRVRCELVAARHRRGRPLGRVFEVGAVEDRLDELPNLGDGNGREVVDERELEVGARARGIEHAAAVLARDELGLDVVVARLQCPCHDHGVAHLAQQLLQGAEVVRVDEPG